MKIERTHDEETENSVDGAEFDNFHDESLRDRITTVSCECGSDRLLVNFIKAPFTGGYLKVSCEKCGRSEVLMDDYA